MITFVLGWPGGLALAVLNWKRMNRAGKAMAHAAGGILATAAVAVLLLLLPRELSPWLSVFWVLTSLGALFYLRSQTKKDIEAFRAKGGQWREAGWISGCAVGFITLAASLMALIIFITFIVLVTGRQVPT